MERSDTLAEGHGELAGIEKVNMAKVQIAVNEYQVGTNERLDRMLDPGDEVWIVNGPKGRVPVLAGSKEEALEAYAKVLQ